MTGPGRIDDPALAREFVLAGAARLTIVSPKTGARFTYRVRVNRDREEGDPKPDGPWFVGVRVPGSVEEGFQFLGTVFADGAYRHGKRSHLDASAPYARAFAWLWTQLSAGKLECEFWHEGACGACGRALIEIQSLMDGLGPICSGRRRRVKAAA